jgi:hypothetical protein
MNGVRILLAIAAGAWCVPGVSGAEALPESLRMCMSEQQDSRRLECFDRETARLAQGTERGMESARPATYAFPAAPAAVTAAAPAAPAAAAPAATVATAAAAPVAPSRAVEPTLEEKFGYRGNLARANLDQQKAAEANFEELTAIITRLSTQPRGEIVVTLDNGQVWTQKSSDRPLRLAVGEQVSIRKATLGSYLLSSANSRGAMRVIRVQ